MTDPKMDMIFRAETYAWLNRVIGAGGRSLAIAPMRGSTSSSLFRIDHAGRRFVLRVLDNREWLAEEPDLASHEAAALDEAQKAGLSAPRLVAYAPDDVGFGAPVVLMTFLEGSIDLRPARFQTWLEGLAGELAAIHRHPADAFPWRFRSWVNRATLAPPVWSVAPSIWERAIEYWLGADQDLTPLPPSSELERPNPGEGGRRVRTLSRAVFIHRDYHPVNVLWRGGAVSGVVDWINACRGPAGVDVAHCRVNLAQMYGSQTADQFLDAYLDVAGGFAYDPYWDVDALLDMCLPQPTYYQPWQHFGLGVVAPGEMRRRVDALLERVMMRA